MCCGTAGHQCGHGADGPEACRIWLLFRHVEGRALCIHLQDTYTQSEWTSISCSLIHCATINFQQQASWAPVNRNFVSFLPPTKIFQTKTLAVYLLLLGDKYRAWSLTSHVWCLLSLLCLWFPLGSSLQLLHICIEGWGNWRWSEAFSVDNMGTLLRTIQYKGRTASLIIKVLQLNGVQKQVHSCWIALTASYHIRTAWIIFKIIWQVIEI